MSGVTEQGHARDPRPRVPGGQRVDLACGDLVVTVADQVLETGAPVGELRQERGSHGRRVRPVDATLQPVLRNPQSRAQVQVPAAVTTDVLVVGEREKAAGTD